MPATKASRPATRMNAADRRDLVLAAATTAFARGGWSGTSTDAIAKEAGVSQPYVVRMFGTKAELFREVFARALGRIVDAFDTELDRIEADPDAPVSGSEDYWSRLGAAYGDLIADGDILLVLMHGFTAGGTPEIGVQARSAMAQIYTLIRTRTGCAPEVARQFIANGMLLNVLLAMRAPDHLADHDGLAELSDCAFGGLLDTTTAAGRDVR